MLTPEEIEQIITRAEREGDGEFRYGRKGIMRGAIRKARPFPMAGREYELGCQMKRRSS
ncbi:hypothetical protein ABT117_16785 [Streptomyces sp. NPDC002262]|uniref:hypothetical protein n=1 Tax=Streptomyces sp. NPDC002262 TaxID=3154414 RepID=UPI003316E425